MKLKKVVHARHAGEVNAQKEKGKYDQRQQQLIRARIRSTN